MATAAARAGSLPILRYLHCQGINILRAPREGADTPLYEAVSEGHTNLTRFLLKTVEKSDTIHGVGDSLFNRIENFTRREVEGRACRIYRSIQTSPASLWYPLIPGP